MNQVNLLGRLTQDIVIKKTQTGKSVTNFNLAVRKDKDSADYVNCVAWETNADNLAKFTRKGSMIGVTGRIGTRNYEDSSGKKVYITEVVITQFYLTESAKKDEYGNKQPREVPPSYVDNSGNTFFNESDDGPVLDISSDDLPF